MKTIIVILFLLAFDLAHAQSFADKTNAIKVNYTQPVVATTLPSISWTVPRIESSVSGEESIMLEATVISDSPLKEVRILVMHGGETRDRKLTLTEDQLKYELKQPLRLMDGDNVIKLLAENVKGGQVSSTRSVLMGKDALADAVDINRKDYALIFATDQYDHWDDLVNPINDARMIEKLLKEKYGFKTEIVENATLEELNDKLFDYNTKKFNPQDQLFVFFAGHGHFDETLGEGYIVANNSLLNDKGKSSYLSHNILRERLDNMKCEHIFLTMDVCFGGTFDKKLAKARGAEDMDETIDKQYLVKKLNKRTRKFLTSGSKEYVPDGTPGKNSPFATQFILALKEIGGGKGRVLSLLELQPYFLRLSTEPYFGSFGHDDAQSDFVFVAKQN
jgi:hypothetical protein